MAEKCSINDAKIHAVNHVKTEFETLSKKLEQDISGKLAAESNFNDFVTKQKNLIAFGLAKNPSCVTRKLQNEKDLGMINELLPQNCPLKCSFSVCVGKPEPGKCRPIKLMFRSPIERDTASFFLSNNIVNIKVAFPGLGFSHDRTNAELAQKKKYDALKQQLNEKEAAGESGLKI